MHAEEWSGEDVGVGDVITALCRLRDESAHETEGPDLRTSVMTHLAWVPPEWEEAAVETLAGLEERHPSRGAPASIVNPLLVPALPVFLRWRGRPAFGEENVDELVEVCDRLIVDSREWPDVPHAYEQLPFDRAACSDIAWRRTEPWRRCLAGLWPGIAELDRIRVEGPAAEASLLAGWLRSRLERPVELEHDDAKELAAVDVDGSACPVPREGASSSDLLSAELDEFARDRVYEAAARAATG